MLCCVSERPEMLEGCLVECVAILASTRSAPTYEYPDMPTRDASRSVVKAVTALQHSSFDSNRKHASVHMIARHLPLPLEIVHRSTHNYPHYYRDNV